MTLTLVVVGLVLAPPTGWLLGGWLAVPKTAGSQAGRSGEGELQMARKPRYRSVRMRPVFRREATAQAHHNRMR